VDDFAGRMTAVGWLALKHVDRISGVVTNPATDKASLDLEVMALWAILREKVKDQPRFVSEKEDEPGWDMLLDELDKLKEDSEKVASGQRDTEVAGVDVSAERLTIRLMQFEMLVSCAVSAGVLDVASLPHDDRRGKR
jgi:hypothetical protein